MNITQARATTAHHAFRGNPHHHLGELTEELAPHREAHRESERHKQRDGARQREIGAGPKCEPVFIDRVLVHWFT